MIWPGMGSEVVFELYREKHAPSRSHYVVRVLFGGQAMRSSHPDLGLLEFVPVDVLLDYFDGFTGGGNASSKVSKMCDDDATTKSEL